MKIIPAIIATVFGVIFLAVELTFNYYPPVPTVEVNGLFETPEQSKARAAVLVMLLYPEAAAIDGLRTVKVEAAQYVCGKVNGKNRSGSYAGPRDFVYDVAGDSAAIDDDESIVRSHRAFRRCPEENKSKPIEVDLDKMNKLAKVLPKPDIRVAPAFAAPGGGGSSGRAGGSQDLRQGIEGLKQNAEQRVGLSSGSSGGAQISSSTATSAPANESGWRGDQPPKTWPSFAADNPLSKRGADFSDREAIELASDVERRWQRYESGKSASRPSVGEVEEAQRALLTINEQNPRYPEAWAAFVRLQKIRRDAVG